MATLRIPDEGCTLTDAEAVRQRLQEAGIEYERWDTSRPLGEDATPADVLVAYADEVERLKARGGYVTADVIDVKSTTPGLEAMLERFRREHWHDDDEVRFIVRGKGIFHLRPGGGPVLALEVEAGDLVRVPHGTWHWFDLCETREIRAIRLFKDPAGWAPRYTGSGVDAGYQPVCLGPSDLPHA